MLHVDWWPSHAWPIHEAYTGKQPLSRCTLSLWQLEQILSKFVIIILLSVTTFLLHIYMSIAIVTAVGSIPVEWLNTQLGIIIHNELDRLQASWNTLPHLQEIIRNCILKLRLWISCPCDSNMHVQLCGKWMALFWKRKTVNVSWEYLWGLLIM